MRSFSLVLLFGIFSLNAYANSPQNYKTVTTFNGNWSGKMTATTPYDQQPETFDYKMECHYIASTQGVDCTYEGHATVGDLTQSCLIGFDEATHSVHSMCISNMGEVHDHKGKWVNNTIQYEPYIGTMGDQKITENITTEFPDNKTMIHTSEIIMADGQKMTFVFKAQKN